MDALAICLLIKDENKYLSEWVKWHLGIGVNHFYVYDNGSAVPARATILAEFDSRLFTFVDWSGPHAHTQIDAYNHFLRHYGAENKWVAFIDTDEFIHCNVLDMRRYEAYPYIRVRWKVFDADGQVEYSPEDVQKRFLHESKHSIGIDHKAIVQTSRVNGMMVHDAVADGYAPVYADDMIIHHYYTRSLEEWKEKILRGTCSPECRRRYDEFFTINPDLIAYCDDSFSVREQCYEQMVYRFDIRIMAHPSRRDMVMRLLEQLGMGEEIVVWDDRESGGDAIYTAEKAWRSPLSPGITHRVVLQDDVIVSKNFLKICGDIINTVPDKPVSLFNMFVGDLPEYGHKTCCYFVTHEMCGPGIVMPVKYIDNCWEWINERQEYGDYCPCDDIMITRYFETHGVTAYTTIPSIVQHISDSGHKSLITVCGNVKYLGDRISGTFRDEPQDDFTVFVQPASGKMTLRMSFIRQRVKRILEKGR